MKQGSGDVRAMFEAGLKLSAEGRYRETAGVYREALTKDPGQAYLWASLGDALAKLNQNEKALAHISHR